MDDSPDQIADLVLLVHSSGWALVEGLLTMRFGVILVHVYISDMGFVYAPL